MKQMLFFLIITTVILAGIGTTYATGSGAVCDNVSQLCTAPQVCENLTCKGADGFDTKNPCGGPNDEQCHTGETCSGICYFPDPNQADQKYYACDIGNGKYACVQAIDENNCAEQPACLGKRCDLISPNDGKCSGGGAAFSKQSPLPNVQAGDLGLLISQFFNWSLSILGIAVFTLIIFSGFQWLTAAGDPGKIGKARSRMYNALLGAILLLSSYIILKVINPDLISQQVNLPANPQSGSSNQ